MAHAAASSRYERLVDRWIDLTRWPTAKKTALAMGIALVFHQRLRQHADAFPKYVAVLLGEQLADELV